VAEIERRQQVRLMLKRKARMGSILVALFGMAALASILDFWDRETDPEDYSTEIDNSSEVSGNVFEVSVGLKNESFELGNFDPEVDKVILETRTLDLDFSLDQTGGVLSVFYGDTVTLLSAPWGVDGIGNSVVVRHIVGEGDNESAVDYSLKISDEVDTGSEPAFVEIDDSVVHLSVSRFHGVLNLGDDNNWLYLDGDFLSYNEVLNLYGDGAVLGTVPDFNVNGGDGNDVIQFSNLRGSVSLGQGADQFEMIGGQAQVDLGDGDDLLDSSSSQSINDMVVGSGGSGNDDMSGTSGHDYIDGGRDEDLLFGLGGEDRIVGGTAGDSLYGGSGNDVLISGRDVVFLPPGSQTTFEDFSDGAADNVFGGAGDDILVMDQFDTACGGSGSDDFTVYYDPTKEGPAGIDDFDHTTDSLKVVVKLSDELLNLWNGHRLDDGTFEVTPRVEWSLVDASTSKYMLQVGGYNVVEVISVAPPAIGSVLVLGYVSA
jgi:Ca2+-binding RTX toxin-like protein